MATYYVSAEYSRGWNNRIVVKELGVTRLGEDDVQLVFHNTFRPPCFLYELPEDIRRTNFFLHRHMHRIGWNAGQYSHLQLVQILQELLPEGCELVAKGTEFVRFLFNLLHRPVMDLDGENPPSLLELPVPVHNTCFVGHSTKNCAKFKSLVYGEWLRHNSIW